MTKLRLDETETHLSQMADDRNRWIVYTDDPVWIARLHKIGADFICDVGYGSEYSIPDNWVKIKPPNAPKGIAAKRQQERMEREGLGQDT